MGIDAQMLVKTRATVTPEQVRRWSWEMVGEFGHDNFWMFGEGDLALRLTDEFTQDGEPITPEPGETLIECHLDGRYYGPEYERGDAPLLISIAGWLEANIPGASVWYGGDSSGVLATLFDERAREVLLRHFVRVGHLPYQGYFGRGENGPMCPRCHENMLHSGGGGGETFWFCYGCPNKAISNASRQMIWSDGADVFTKVKEFRKRGVEAFEASGAGKEPL
jgi:hypothetical protein